jgi:hypothetical protein
VGPGAIACVGGPNPDFSHRMVHRVPGSEKIVLEQRFVSGPGGDLFSGMGLTAARQPISGGNGGDAGGALDDIAQFTAPPPKA